jgi:hypothetical protein
MIVFLRISEHVKIFTRSDRSAGFKIKKFSAHVQNDSYLPVRSKCGVCSAPGKESAISVNMSSVIIVSSI